MKTVALVLIFGAALGLSGCGKLGVSGHVSQMLGNWAEVTLPEGCKVKLLAASDHTTAVLCEDGRLFH